MRRWMTLILAVATLLALSSCGRGEESAADSSSEPNTNASQASGSEGANQTPSSALASNYEGALPPTNQLVLGILRLEETDDAVNGAQAATMLPLWQALQSGSIQNPSERAAIMRQIEGALSEAQIEAIGAMQLTFTDMTDWAQANGIEMPQFGQGGRQGQARRARTRRARRARRTGKTRGPGRHICRYVGRGTGGVPPGDAEPVARRTH